MLTYVAAPYSSNKVFLHYLLQNEVAQMAREGLLPFSPILHWHNVAVAHDLPTDAVWWWRYNKTMLDTLRHLTLITFRGWEESVGVDLELRRAEEMSYPIVYRAPIY